MMILRSSPASPFGRKVIICAALAGLSERIEVVATDVTDPTGEIHKLNPLGKIPTLILEDGTVYFDSRVIAEYLDHLAGGDFLIPAPPLTRFRTLTQAALADGIADASLLQIYETRFRDTGKQDAKWLALQNDKVRRGLEAFDISPPIGRRDIAHVGLACALGYLDLRFAGAWRNDHRNLVVWLEGFSADVPAFAATKVKPA
jgi:glutathione S-transferase